MKRETIIPPKEIGGLGCVISVLDIEPKRSDLKTIGNIEVSNEVIGQGSHGTFVYAGYFKPSNKEIEKREVAVKRLIRGHQSLADKETRILLKLENHENVVRYFGSAVQIVRILRTLQLKGVG